jgi:inhibitor of KinA sporulation pathway (predicted exonuclease)
MIPCRILADAAQAALATPSGVAAYEEKSRDFKSFDKRKGDLPVQLASDGDWDMRSLLHRDGSVRARAPRRA